MGTSSVKGKYVPSLTEIASTEGGPGYRSMVTPSDVDTLETFPAASVALTETK